MTKSSFQRTPIHSILINFLTKLWIFWSINCMSWLQLWGFIFSSPAPNNYYLTGIVCVINFTIYRLNLVYQPPPPFLLRSISAVCALIEHRTKLNFTFIEVNFHTWENLSKKSRFLRRKIFTFSHHHRRSASFKTSPHWFRALCQEIDLRWTFLNKKCWCFP